MRIMNLLALVASVAVFTPSCAHATPPPTVLAADGGPQPYPFWTADTIANSAPGDKPTPDGAAFPVAPGYFLVSFYAMGPAGIDMGEDPRVTLSDGQRAYDGEFVAVNTDYRLGMIRSKDFQPRSYALATNLKGIGIVGMREAKDVRGKYEPATFPMLHCADVPQTDDEGHVRFSVVGCQTSGDGLIGLAYLNARSELVALLAPTGRGAAQVGLDATRIRRFIDVYFASSGRYLPKPKY